ncbi:hypothetical protein QYM36_017426 [Artemia franciscana]|uniref:Uncharacterized protein n=1 Tax=Artemia franciscana TaxID=6661 RepID=A0AA88HDB6_ARTSF|nr:hypothetical protein QYM36_017426 [Artemia franciscana]
MSDPSSNPVNPKNRKPHDLSFGNSGASGPVKVEHVSARLHDGSDTHIFKTDPSRKSRFEQISEGGPGRTENPKQGGISDSSPSKAVNSEQMITGEAKGISTQLHAKSGTSIPKIELSPLANPVLPRADWCQLLTSYGAESYFSSLYCYYGLKYNLDQAPLVTAIEADNFELVRLLLFKGENPRELVNKVKEKVEKIIIIMEQRQTQNDPGYPSLIAHWLKKQIEFNIKCKSNTLLPLVCDICCVHKIHRSHAHCKTLKENCHKLILSKFPIYDFVEYNKVYDRRFQWWRQFFQLLGQGLRRFLQYYLENYYFILLLYVTGMHEPECLAI